MFVFNNFLFLSCHIPFFSLVYLETSAATGQNVERAVEILLDRVMRRMEATVDKSPLPHQKSLRCHERDTPPPRSSCYC